MRKGRRGFKVCTFTPIAIAKALLIIGYRICVQNTHFGNVVVHVEVPMVG